ncbi:MAG: alanine racemase [Thioalkalivibrionaceae bacterium]
MQRAARVVLSAQAFRANLRELRACAPQSRLFAVVKAEAYGHGLEWAGRCLADDAARVEDESKQQAYGERPDAAQALRRLPAADGMAVSCVEEACVLREMGINQPILVLQGARNRDEWRLIARLNLQAAVHDESQLTALAASNLRSCGDLSERLWLKVDTGMHRLGFAPESVPGILRSLAAKTPQPVGLMSHYACADSPDHPLHKMQRQRFAQLREQLNAFDEPNTRRPAVSTDNSAAILGRDAGGSDAIFEEWIRPGIASYGASPFVALMVGRDSDRIADEKADAFGRTLGRAPAYQSIDQRVEPERRLRHQQSVTSSRVSAGGVGSSELSPQANEFAGLPSARVAGRLRRLHPVATLQAPVIAVKRLEPGDSVGYGATWTARESGRMAVVAVGYADGYPRHAPSGTPVVINGRRCPLIGRVSMDLITVDVSGFAQAVEVGDWATLWGEGLSVDEVAAWAGTIGYELLTRIHGRVRVEERA